MHIPSIHLYTLRSPGPSGRVASKQHLMVVLQKCRSMANGDTRDPKLICSLVERAAYTNTTDSLIHARGSVMARFIVCWQNQSVFIMVKNLLETGKPLFLTALDCTSLEQPMLHIFRHLKPVQLQDNFRCSQVLNVKITATSEESTKE